MTQEDRPLEWTDERYVPWVKEGEIHYEHLHRYRFAREFVKGKKVLDLACGEGYGVFILSEEAESVIGIDIDETSIRHASLKYVKENIKFIKGSFTDIPIKGLNLFDVIICFEVLEHIEEHDKLMKEVKRLLKDKGIFIVSTPNKYTYSDQPVYLNHFHLKELYFEEFRELLNKNFKNTIFYGQKVFPISNIFPLSKKSEYSKDFVIAKGSKEFFFVYPEKRKARYFIAISSDHPVRDIYNSYLIDISETLFTQRDSQIRKLENIVADTERILKLQEEQINSLERTITQKEEQIANLEGQLDHIYNSHGWKALKAYYRIRDSIFPLSSRRRFLAKFIFHAIINTKGLFKKLKKLSLRDIRFYFKRGEISVLEEKLFIYSQSLSITQQDIYYCWDSPLEKEELHNSFVINGWAIASDGIERVEVYCDNIFLGTASYGLSRPDVQRSYPSIEGSEKSGFHYFVNNLDIGQHTLTIKIITNKGGLNQ